MTSFQAPYYSGFISVRSNILFTVAGGENNVRTALVYRVGGYKELTDFYGDTLHLSSDDLISPNHKAHGDRGKFKLYTWMEKANYTGGCLYT